MLNDMYKISKQLYSEQNSDKILLIILSDFLLGNYRDSIGLMCSYRKTSIMDVIIFLQDMMSVT